jgi:hypothetical protein
MRRIIRVSWILIPGILERPEMTGSATPLILELVEGPTLADRIGRASLIR